MVNSSMEPGISWIVISEDFRANLELGRRSAVHIPAGARVIVLKSVIPNQVRFSRGGKNYGTLEAHFERSCKKEDG
jgi:hypothetical protein